MGGKNAPKVYDFLMSIHYGLCHGPIDRLNKVWIKDKSILCGNYTGRQDVSINQPERFGGDDGEGGAVGTMELYDGSDDQLASTALSSRFDRTPETMPGYRGLASLFFRGNGRRGFRWTSNNPYLPGVEASVTRNPTTLSAANAQIFPVANVDEEGLPVSSEDSWITFSDDYSLTGPDVNLNDTIDPLTFDATVGVKVAPILDWSNTGTSAMVADRDTSGAKWFWIARPGFGNGSAARDFPISTFGITPEVADNGQNRLEGEWVTVRSGTFSTATYTIIALNAAYGSLGVVFSENRITTALEPQYTGPILTGPLPVGTRHLRVVITSQNARVYPRELQVQWRGFEVNYCDPDDEGLRLLPNANPAHIIHETMVNTEWGKGEDPSLIDTAGFLAASQTYKDEFFGLAFVWARQGSVEDFIQQILDHTQTMMFIHPRTGLWTLKPLRGDYDAATVLAGRRLDPSTCQARKRKRRAWGETVNEVVVKYTDPQTEEEATVTAHNLANIAIQGGVISETRPYPGIRDEWLARFVANRDVIEAGHPLYTAEIEASRAFWDVVPGDVLAHSWPEDGIEDMIVRVLKVDYGTPTDRTVKISVVEDVFALEKSSYGATQTSEWQSIRALPEPVDAQMAMATPMPLLVRSGFDVAEIIADFPATGVMLFGADDDDQTIDIAVDALVTRNDGSTGIDTITNIAPVRSLILETALAAQASTTVAGSFIATLTSDTAEQGDLILIGSSEAAQEIAMLGAYNSGADTWTLWRGIYDTVPSVWAIGTRVWVLPEFQGQGDPQERAATEVLSYRLRPRTSEGRITYAEAAALNYTVTQRPHQPFRPANTQIAGNGFALADYTAAPVAFPIAVSWVNRNRTVEDQVALKWTEANVTPEAGQTTVIRVFNDSGVLAGEITGLTGTTYNMTSGNFFGVTYGYLEFVSSRDGIRSRPGARRWFDMRQTGYGNSYGLFYG